MADLIDRQQALALRFTHAINEDGVVYVQYREYQNGIVRLPSANCQQVTGKLDCISRQAAIDALAKELYHNEEDYRTAVKAIGGLPSAQPERKRGKWIPVTNGRGGFECDRCHCYAPSYQDGVEWLSAFCPNCGADMRGERNDG